MILDDIAVIAPRHLPERFVGVRSSPGPGAGYAEIGVRDLPRDHPLHDIDAGGQVDIQAEAERAGLIAEFPFAVLVREGAHTVGVDTGWWFVELSGAGGE